MSKLSELRQRLLHPYYTLHFFYGIAYVVVRLNQLKLQALNFEESEPKSFALLFGMSLWKCLVAASAEELSSVVILYTKFFTFCSLFWRFGFWSSVLYAVGWIALSTIFPQPWYLGDSKIYELNAAAFRDKVLRQTSNSNNKKPSSTSSTSSSTSTTTASVDDIEGPRITEIVDDESEDKKTTSNSKEDKKKELLELDAKYWVVMLYANWSVSCINFEAVLAKLSLQYDAPHLKFGQVDVDIYPDLAEEFGVSKDPASFDLPTLLLFQQGKEIRRLPELTVTKEGVNNSKASAAKDTITRLGWSKKPATVISAFQLEKIMREKTN